MPVKTQRIYNELGDGAPDFPAGMPTVGGDPIVESGSNSDGEWTRWADGTQQCMIPNKLLSQSGTGQIEASWTFPSVFLNSDITLSLTAKEVMRFSNNLNNTIFSADAQSCTLYVAAPAATFSSGASYNYSAFATGRWK